jgi:hypothetical protein
MEVILLLMVILQSVVVEGVVQLLLVFLKLLVKTEVPVAVLVLQLALHPQVLEPLGKGMLEAHPILLRQTMLVAVAAVQMLLVVMAQIQQVEVAEMA